ncbi:MAG: PqqD family protein [Calditrichaeota bacterium]|nr:PqqD family protein [Calditrichota bacterium]
MSRLNQLAINDEGFLFDPSTGESYTVNPSGLHILKALKANLSVEDITKSLQGNFDMVPSEAERDVLDFMGHLRTYRLL